MRLFILGFPGLYGGAGVELHHQIHLWAKAFPEIELHLIPTNEGYKNEPLYEEMINLGVTVHGSMDFSKLESRDAIINFCSREFLISLKKINDRTRRVIWVNCMTWLFPMEKEAAKSDLIRFYLYQRPQIRDNHEKELRSLGATGDFLVFNPYFESDGWEFSVKDQDKTNIGRISRQDADKFSSKTLHIYEYITSPKFKHGHFLGFNEKSKNKVGNPFGWITTYKDQNELPVKDFYNTIDFIVQPMDTTENWPRIGFEAMFTGKPLVVDDRGGWQYMVEHKKTGFLCKDQRDFIYWGTRLSYEPELRLEIATNALQKAKELSSFEVSKESWRKVFEKAYD